MTFYDELGVYPNASPDEVRDAFRALVRIVHPDHQTEPQLKQIAEKQMRKLNRVYEVLSDPEKRRRYDASLDKQAMGRAVILSPKAPITVGPLTERVAWIAAFSVVAAALVWLSWDNPGVIQQQVAERVTRKVPAATAVTAPPVGAWVDEIARLQNQLSAVELERDAAVRELNRLRAPAPKPLSTWVPAEPVRSVAVSGATVAATDLPAPVPPAADVQQRYPVRTFYSRIPPPVALNRAQKPFEGFWFYTKEMGPQRDSPAALYPPEFIETTITEQNGMVRGKYRSRYRITDRAISPDVIFEFAGMATGNTLVCPWTGPGGSRGELTLKMAGENGMTVDWKATDPGSMQGLITGTATLMRRID